MLSILLPVYNYDVTELVFNLQKQAIISYINFEIIVMEDGSRFFTEKNKKIKELASCKYIILDKNIGRSAIRNKLADEAQFEYLLFMDCDAEICSNEYINNYLAFCKQETIAIGGTAYDENIQTPQFSLRLKYGRKREARKADQRNKNNFSTFNFLISKTVFNKVRFDETIRGYGHEDMLFGHQLHKLGYNFFQLENPLIHKGLDDNQSFIRKTEEGVINLFLLHKTGKYPFLCEESKLLATFIRIKNLKLIKFSNFIYSILSVSIIRQLSGKNPSLALYDIYKILYMCNYVSKK